MITVKSISPDRAQTMITEHLGQPDPKVYGLGQTMVRLGYIQPEDAERIEQTRRQSGGVFGRTAVDMGLITPPQLEYALGVHLGFLYETKEPVIIPPQILVARNPYSQQSEEFRSLRTRLTAGGDKEAVRRLALTSTGNGASYAAVNLAASFAQLGRTTLLIDTHLRRPCLGRIFGAAPVPGVTDVVLGTGSYEEARNPTLIRNLDLMTAGRPAPDPQRIVGDAAFTALVDRAAEEFDIVLMLTAPYGLAAECEFVWAVSSGALIVSRKNETRLRDLEKIKSALRRMDTPVAGAIVLG